MCLLSTMKNKQKEKTWKITNKQKTWKKNDKGEKEEKLTKRRIWNKQN